MLRSCAWPAFLLCGNLSHHWWELPGMHCILRHYEGHAVYHLVLTGMSIWMHVQATLWDSSPTIWSAVLPPTTHAVIHQAAKCISRHVVVTSSCRPLLVVPPIPTAVVFRGGVYWANMQLLQQLMAHATMESNTTGRQYHILFVSDDLLMYRTPAGFLSLPQQCSPEDLLVLSHSCWPFHHTRVWIVS